MATRWGASTLALPMRRSTRFLPTRSCCSRRRWAPHLSMSLAGKGALGDHPSDPLGELVVAHQGLRTGPDPERITPAAPVIDRRAGSAGHPADGGQGNLHLGAHRGRFCGGIWSLLFSATFFQISFSKVSSPILRSASRSLRSSSVVARFPFKPSFPASKNSSRQAASRWASTPTSRLTSSSSRPAGGGGLRRASCALTTGCSTGSQPHPVVHRHESHLGSSLFGVRRTRVRASTKLQTRESESVGFSWDVEEPVRYDPFFGCAG